MLRGRGVTSCRVSREGLEPSGVGGTASLCKPHQRGIGALTSCPIKTIFCYIVYRCFDGVPFWALRGRCMQCPWGPEEGAVSIGPAEWVLGMGAWVLRWN